MLGFGKKKKEAPPQLVLTGADGGETARMPLVELALPEEVVLELSRMYFNDPEPCEIHRAAVHKRAMMELTELCPPGHDVPLDRLPPLVQRYFVPAPATVRIERHERSDD